MNQNFDTKAIYTLNLPAHHVFTKQLTQAQEVNKQQKALKIACFLHARLDDYKQGLKVQKALKDYKDNKESLDIFCDLLRDIKKQIEALKTKPSAINALEPIAKKLEALSLPKGMHKEHKSMLNTLHAVKKVFKCYKKLNNTSVPSVPSVLASFSFSVFALAALNFPEIDEFRTRIASFVSRLTELAKQASSLDTPFKQYNAKLDALAKQAERIAPPPQYF